MSQTTWDTIIPSSTSGNQLAADLTEWKAAFDSTNKGPSRPATLDEGGLWIDDSLEASPDFTWVLKCWNGIIDITLLTINVSTGQVTFSGSSGEFEISQVSANAVGPLLKLIKERIANSGQTLIGDSLGEIQFIAAGDDNSNPVSATMRVVATDNGTATTAGAYMVIEGVSTGGISLEEWVRLQDGKVAIGLIGPEEKLHILGNIKAETEEDTAVGPILNLKKKRVSGLGQVLSGDILGSVDFLSTDEAGDEIAAAAKIKSMATQNHSTTAQGTKLVFEVKETGETALTEKLVIADNLKATGEFQVVGTIKLDAGSHGTTINPNGSGGYLSLTLPTSAGTNGQVLTTNGSGVLSWTTVSGGGGSSSGISGSIQFSDGSGGFSSDATNLFWDDTNNQLTVSPGVNGTVAIFGTGAFMSTFAGDGFFSAGSTLSSGGAWTATQTASSIAYFSSGLEPGTLIVFGDTGLTPAAGFSPTPRFRVKPTGVVEVSGGELQLAGSSSGFVGHKGAANAGSTTYTWPNADGTSGYFLKTDGSGNLSWDAAGGTPGADSINGTMIRLANDQYLRARNAANTADINILKVGTGNTIVTGTHMEAAAQDVYNIGTTAGRYQRIVANQLATTDSSNNYSVDVNAGYIYNGVGAVSINFAGALTWAGSTRLTWNGTNIDVNTRKVVNVVAGTATTDAANYGQVQAAGVWNKYTITHTALQAASLTNDIATGFTLPIGALVEAVMVKTTEAFAGTGITDYDITLGIAGLETKYLTAYDVDSAVSGGNYQLSNALVGGADFGATEAIRIYATAVGANLDQSTNGSIDIWIKYSQLP